MVYNKIYIAPSRDIKLVITAVADHNLPIYHVLNLAHQLANRNYQVTSMPIPVISGNCITVIVNSIRKSVMYIDIIVFPTGNRDCILCLF